METWLGQYCIYVTDLERTIAFYETLGLECTSRTDIPDIKEAILENPAKGGKIQLAQHLKRTGPIEMGNAFWKLYVATNDIDRMYKEAMADGYASESEPQRGERWPMTIAFIRDPDGYLVELTQRHPWRDGDSSTYAWLNQYCVNVADLERTIAFYETLGLECTSRTDLGKTQEAILENPAKGGKIQLADHEGQDSVEMGTAMWKLYVHTDDCKALHDAAVAAGYTSVREPVRLERWPTTVGFVEDPDGYQVELVQRHPD
jgi:catechol 2,3-dioxygenase-like lactoylglutathione lyase family enzyme